MKKSILTAALLGGIALPFAGAAAPADAGVQDVAKQEAKAAAEDPAIALAAEYEAAVKAHKQKIKEADRKDRAAIRAEAPYKTYWPKFEELASQNNGRALLWLADNIKANKSIKKDQRAKVLEPLYAALIEHHADADWFGGALKSLSKNAREFEPKKVGELYKSVVKNAKSDKVKAEALYFAASALKKSDAKTSEAFLAQIIEEYPDSHYYTKAMSVSVSPADSEQGKAAPDFYGETIDGFGFHLEDYRGKVVVLDFYGFW